MADDFGDDAGQRLCDWAVRIGMEAARTGGGDAELRYSVDALVRAMENARDMAPVPDEGRNRGTRVPQGFAKLDLHEFRDLPDYDAVQAAIDSKLADAGLWHGFREEGEITWLVFRVADAPAVSNAFGDLARDARRAGDRAQEVVRERAADLSLDAEPLEERAQRAREASRVLSGPDAPEVGRDMTKVQQRFR